MVSMEIIQNGLVSAMIMGMGMVIMGMVMVMVKKAGCLIGEFERS